MSHIALFVLIELTTSFLLPVAHQPLFTSSLTMCEIHGMHHSGIPGNYTTEQLLCKQQL